MQAFTLKKQDQPRLPRLERARAKSLWEIATPYIVDDYGQIGRLSPDRRQLEWSLIWPGDGWQPVRATKEEDIADNAAAVTLDPVDAPEGAAFTDVHLGESGLIALPFSNGTDRHGLMLMHLRRRWQTHCMLPFKPLRAWVDTHDQIWVASESSLGLCRGAPLPQPYYPRADRFEPVNKNPDPLRLLWQQTNIEPDPLPLLWQPTLPQHGGLIALAANHNHVALLVMDKDNPELQQLLIRDLSSDEQFPTVYPLPADLPLATDIAWLEQNQLLLLHPLEEGDQRHQNRDCAMIMLSRNPDDGSPITHLLPERWPRHSESDVRFVRHRSNHPHTLTEDGPIQLYRLAQAHYAHLGSVTLSLPLDSGSPDTVWHRLCLEACIPPGCRIAVEAWTFNTIEDNNDNQEDWHRQPDLLWLPYASELPFAHSSFNSVAEREGLFEVLLQRANGAVRDLCGQYLQLRLTLSGDGRHTPSISAMRVWYPRFSWQSNFLPRHFHQEAPVVTVKTTESVEANGADLRERMLACFESLMTPLEDRIAAAETLLYPDATPAPFLPWLAAMTATPLPAHWPTDRQRRWIAQHGQLQPIRGTFAGLCKALNIITDGGVQRGQVIPVEMFRLRRTFTTILGIDMDDRDHPLTLGTGQSGNSLVGESLILTDDQKEAFLSLLAPELATNTLEQQTIARFFDHCAHRLTIVLHGQAKQQQQIIAEMLPALVPAIVQWQFVVSDHPFVLGLSPLLGIDTYLEQEPEAGRVQLNHSHLGQGHLIHNPVALSPEHALPPVSFSSGD